MKRSILRVSSRFSGIWLISSPGFGILEEKGTRFGIVAMTGTRDLAILTGGNREISLQRNRDSGIPETEICKENQAVILAHLCNVGNSRTMMIQMIDMPEDKKILTFKALLY